MINKMIAAIDIGTNSFHMIVVKIKDAGNFEIIDREKEVIRLGEGNPGDMKLIGEAAITRAVEALKRFKGIAQSHLAAIRAVATSAVREAHNKHEFINKVLAETGIEIEVISGYEEARLIYLGILKSVPVFNKKSLIIDIGGGSTELLIGLNGIPIRSVSLKLGAVRLTKKFFPDFEITLKKVDECRHWVEGELYQVVSQFKNENFEICVGSSGTIMSVGLILNGIRTGTATQGTILNNFEFSLMELNKVENEVLSKKTVSKRKKIIGLDEKRADIFPAGIIILSSIFKLFGLSKILISGYSLREGIILDSIGKNFSDSAFPNFEDIRKESIKQLSSKFLFDQSHCELVAKLATKMFDDLSELHGLDSACKEYLNAAALLHDIGYHLSHTNHHYHSYYIVRNSELLGFNELEIEIIANTARYHRKSHPKSTHPDFVKLPIHAREIVRKLSAILRITDSLDRTHKKLIKDIKCVYTAQKVLMNIIVVKDADISIELWNLERRKLLFEEVFNKKLLIHTS